MNARFAPAGALRGEVVPPPDKSISHRAALLGAMAAEPVRIANFLDAADTNSTLAVVGRLGALVEPRPDELVIRGVGMREAVELDSPIDVGNAGTLMRLLPGWLVAQEGRSYTLDGDDSIRRRPVDRVAEPLGLMGAEIEATEGRYPPFTVHGARLRAIDYDLPVASAQVKSCILLAALTADGTTNVTEPAPSRDHTERMLVRAGVTVRREGAVISVVNCDELELDDLSVPGDLSSAAFLIAAGVLVPGSRLLVRDVGVNRTRTGFLRILERMGGIAIGDLEPEADDDRIPSDEPTTDLDVAHGPLVGTVVEPEEVPLAIDELPLVALLGCFAEGETVVRGAQELRVKESDRIEAVVDALRSVGVRISATEDGFRVRGVPTRPRGGGRVQARGDHRIAMLGAVAGLVSREPVEVVDAESVAVSFPGFFETLETLRASNG
ncbi:MAG: 3-phosphoshikimate 1-carboxyvinyltransferase [Gaiellaceae bacterium]